MAKWSRAPGQFLGGQWVEHKADFFFIFQIFKFFRFSDIKTVSKNLQMANGCFTAISGHIFAN